MAALGLAAVAAPDSRPGQRVRTLDRYLLREFTGYLVLGLVGFVTIFLVVDVFEKIDVFLDHRAPATLIARFYLYKAPQVVIQVLPVALLLATFLSFGQLSRFGELIAMRASGVSTMRLLGPVLGGSVTAMFASLLLGEFVVPRANEARDRIYHEQIQRIPRAPETERADVTYQGDGGRIYYMRLYLVREQRMHEVSLQEFRRGAIVRRIDAAEATWDSTRWVFSSGYLRTFEDRGAERVERVEPFTRMAIDGIRERPEDFAKENRDPDEMNYFELRRHVERVRAGGGRVANYLVDLHLKLAFPLINVIVVLIGGSVATRLRMQSAALGFGLSVAIAFVYYAFMQAGKALGHNGAFPPYLAAWLGDIVFGAVAVAMTIQAQRR